MKTKAVINRGIHIIIRYSWEVQRLACIQIGQSGFEPTLGTLRCVLGKDT